MHLSIKIGLKSQILPESYQTNHSNAQNLNSSSLTLDTGKNSLAFCREKPIFKSSFVITFCRLFAIIRN
ncbi:MAG: hypothetical protein D6687_09830 [Acidobacteria bacterium]|nr:MAG: hypothetical protein D6687_09830 [Acidobacteriota bacterium]